MAVTVLRSRSCCNHVPTRQKVANSLEGRDCYIAHSNILGSYRYSRTPRMYYSCRHEQILPISLRKHNKELPSLSSRCKAAQNVGFKYVECSFPYAEGSEELEEACKEAGLEFLLINSWPGKMERGELGLAALPDRAQDFRMQLELSIDYANCLNCKRMNIMAGRTSRCNLKEMEETFLDNLKFAAERLQEEGIMCLIEPLNSRITCPNYFLNNFHTAVEYIKKVNHPNLKLLFDFYHAQIISGDLTANLKKFLPYTGHIQIAQVPDRGEPDLNGEINYKYIFKLLEDMGYDGYIGCEYKPRGTTEEGLKWIQELGVTL